MGISFGRIFGGSFLGSLAANATAKVISILSEGVSAIINKGKEAVSEGIRLASQAQNALKGLESVALFKGIEPQSAQDAIQNLKGVRLAILSIGDATASVKNLLSAGYGLAEAIALIDRFTDSAAFNRQEFYSLSEAVRVTTEGIRQQNSVTSDAAGVQKNLSVILKERGFQLEDLGDKTKGAAAREALYKGLIAETAAQVGDADKIANTYTGTLAAQEVAYQNLYRAIGNIIINNEGWKESEKIVTEQINGTTEAINNQESATHQFAVTLLKDLAHMRAHMLPFMTFLINVVRAIGAAVAAITVGVLSGIKALIAGAIVYVRNALISVLNLFIDSVNKVIGMVQTLGPTLSALIPGGIALSGLTPFERFDDRSPSATAAMGIDFGESFKVFKSLLGDVSGSLGRMNGAVQDGANASIRITDAIEQERAARNSRGLLDDQIKQARTANGGPSIRATDDLAGGTAGGAGKRDKKLSQKEYLDQLIEFNAQKYGVDPDLVRAIMAQESRGKLRAMSNKGAGGLMQLMPGTAADYGVKDRFDPKQNISGGVQYLAKLIKMFDGNIPLALAAYNAGEGAVIKYGNKIPPYKETQKYVPEVLGRYAQLKTGREDGTVVNVGGQNAMLVPNLVSEMIQRLSSEPLTTPTHQLGTRPLSMRLNKDEAFRKDRSDAYKEQVTETLLRQRNMLQERFLAIQTASLAQDNALMDIETELATLQAQRADDQFGDQRRLLMAKSEQVDLERSILRVQDEAANSPYNQSLRIQLALLEDINSIRRRDEEAIMDANRAQLEITEQSIYSATQANAQVLRFMASQKGLTAIVADAKIGVMEKTFDGIDDALDRIIPKAHGFGDILKQIVGDLLKLEASKWLRKLLGLEGGGQGPGGTPNFGGGGFNLNSLLNMFGGGNGSGNSGGGFMSTIRHLFGLGGRAAAPAAQAATAAATGGAGGLSGLAGAGGLSAFAAPSVAALFGGGGAAAATVGAATNAFAAPSALALAGGGSAAAAGTGAAGLSSLIPLLTNPFTIAAVGAGVAGYFLWKKFRNGTEKKLRQAIKAAYGIDVKDQSVLKQIKEIGEGVYGRGNVSKHINEVLRLEPVKEMLMAYAESTGQTAKGLTTQRELMDPNFSGNNHVVRSDSSSAAAAAFGTPPASASLNSNSSSEGAASSSFSGGSSVRNSNDNGGAPAAMIAAHIAALQANTEANQMLLQRVTSMPPGVVVAQGLGENPNPAADALHATIGSSYRTDELRRGFNSGGTL